MKGMKEGRGRRTEGREISSTGHVETFTGEMPIFRSGGGVKQNGGLKATAGIQIRV